MSQRNQEREILVFNHRNNPALPDSTKAELTRKSIGVLDWGTDRSWDYKQASDDHQGAARRSFKAIQHLNENGGYGVMHTKGFEEVSIGKVEPPCIRFLHLEDSSGEERYFKAFQFETYAQVDVEDQFPEVHEVLTNYAFMETLQLIEKKEDTESDPKAIPDAYVELMLTGKLDRTALVFG